jgi:hypothetical protein
MIMAIISPMITNVEVGRLDTRLAKAIAIIVTTTATPIP